MLPVSLSGRLESEYPTLGCPDDLADEYARWCREQERSGRLEAAASDRVLSTCTRRVLVSRSKGRSKGYGRKRKEPGYYRRKLWKEVELIGYGGGRFYMVKNGYGDGHTDCLAQEALGPEVGQLGSEAEFLRRLRAVQ